MDWNTFMADIEAKIGSFSKEVPETVKGFGIMGKAAKTNGALSEKTKEIMALGIAIATRCDSCIGFHVRALVRLESPAKNSVRRWPWPPIWVAAPPMPIAPRR